MSRDVQEAETTSRPLVGSPWVRLRFPITDWLPRYRREQLRPDLLAGCVVAALAVPQALGYATIAGVPVEVGLYAVPIALIAYAVFGSSKQLILGPVSTVSVMSGSLVAALGPTDVAQAIAFTTAAAICAGGVLIFAAHIRVGWVAEFLSKPIITGFVLGLTLLVVLGELPSLLGIHVGPRDVLGRINGLVIGIGDANLLTIGVSAAALTIVFAGSKLLPRLPWSLVVLVLGLALSQILDLGGRGVQVVGHVPGGLPTPSIPVVPLDRITDIIMAGVALGFVGLAEGLSAARLFAQKRDYIVRTDQELFAAGAGSLASGLMGGLAVAGSLSKTAAVDRSGGRSQVAGLAAAVLSVLAILFFAPTLGILPKAVLSAIVVHAVWGLIDIPSMRRYRNSRKIDFLSAWVATIGVLVAGPLLGLLVAIGAAIFGLVYRSSRVTIDVMGKVPGEKAAWGSVENHPERVALPGVLVLRLNESLFWVNAAQVKDRVLELLDEHPGTKALVLDLESSDQLEITSADTLAALLDRLEVRGIDLYLVRVRFRVRKVLRATGLRQRIGEDHIWHSISQGVRAARKQHGLKGSKAKAALALVPAVPAEVETATETVALTEIEPAVETDGRAAAETVAAPEQPVPTEPVEVERAADTAEDLPESETWMAETVAVPEELVGPRVDEPSSDGVASDGVATAEPVATEVVVAEPAEELTEPATAADLEPIEVAQSVPAAETPAEESVELVEGVPEMQSVEHDAEVSGDELSVVEDGDEEQVADADEEIVLSHSEEDEILADDSTDSSPPKKQKHKRKKAEKKKAKKAKKALKDKAEKKHGKKETAA
ncbi:putative sulfate transporter [Microlunatus phosphovorus NM-1]|uniref:Putative sulfate transporter n=1 Tax=Microlunatus phosphovorus (strain ATCC 700054 / DSM 10555 / JCM 9379 / NBRC 101784 / NCIMB 13414 / VKM Ac-1990 / NM-1) TaxID=1032480 RepID=F5XGG1_MICPN|nr:SulP family inorganic anion transporter [Microlunatus phosphovorus]BAK33068.1 putative sulfate transporter [Microlunatus phosphovorus NM-1]